MKVSSRCDKGKDREKDLLGSLVGVPDDSATYWQLRFRSRASRLGQQEKGEIVQAQSGLLAVDLPASWLQKYHPVCLLHHHRWLHGLLLANLDRLPVQSLKHLPNSLN